MTNTTSLNKKKNQSTGTEWVTSYSELKTHSACPQAWTYAYARGLQAEQESPVFTMGTLWHAMRSSYALSTGDEKTIPGWSSSTVNDTHGLPRTARRSDVLKLAHKLWDNASETFRETALERYRDTIPNRLDAMDIAWQARWSDDLPHEEIIATELTVRRTIAPGITLKGTIDQIYRDTKRNLLVLRDFKTASTLKARTHLDDMMDSQLMLYAWLVAPWLKGKGLGSIQAVSYDRARTVAPREPVLTKAGSLSKSVTDYDLATYLKWSADGVPFEGRKADGSDAGTYIQDPKVISKLEEASERNKWFQRTLTPLNRNIVRSHLMSAIDNAKDSRMTLERYDERKQAPRRYGKQCEWCEFQNICRAEMVAGTILNPDEFDLT